MRTYSFRDEEAELVERLVDDVRLSDGNIMANHEEYCRMMQWEECEAHWINEEDEKQARQWDDCGLLVTDMEYLCE